MDLNIRTDIITLPITMESGLVLNVQVQQPVVLQMSQIAFAEWGKIVGDIHSQADLMLLFNAEAEARQQAIEDLLPLIYAGL